MAKNGSKSILKNIIATLKMTEINFPLHLYKNETDSKLYSGYYLNYFYPENFDFESGNTLINKAKVMKQEGCYYPSGNPMYADKCKLVRVQTAKKQVEKYLREGWQMYIEDERSKSKNINKY